MESRNEQHPTSRYKSYIKESSLPEDYSKRSIRFDTVNDPGGVPYKDNRYESVGDYRQKKQYPSKEIDKRPKESFDKFSAHGTSLASVISCLLYTNKQLVPAIKLRKLIGSSSSSGESKGFVD
ncbi:TPA: hypothetical protein ACTXXA_001737 [Legionella anisa]